MKYLANFLYFRIYSIIFHKNHVGTYVVNLSICYFFQQQLFLGKKII